MRAIRSLPAAVFLAATAITACGGGGWVKDHPDVADRARDSPGSFVEPAFDGQEGLESLAGTYRMRVARGIGRRSFDLAVAVQRPGRVDMNVLDPTGAIQAFLRASDTEVGLYVTEDRVLYRGPATRDAFERALGFDLSARDAVAVLLGSGIAREGLPRGAPSWDPQARRIRIDYGAGASLWLHPATMRFDRVLHRSGATAADRATADADGVATEAADGAAVEVRLQEWTAVQEQEVPSRLEIGVEPDGYAIRLELSSTPRVNFEMPATTFDLTVPADTLVLPLEELARQGGLFRRVEGEEPRDGAGEGV